MRSFGSVRRRFGGLPRFGRSRVIFFGAHCEESASFAPSGAPTGAATGAAGVVFSTTSLYWGCNRRRKPWRLFPRAAVRGCERSRQDLAGVGLLHLGDL